MEPTLDNIAKLVSIITATINTVALLVAGVIAWARWFRNSPDNIRGEIQHTVTHTLLPGSKRLVHVTLILKNKGHATVWPIQAYTKIFQVLPYTTRFTQRLAGGTARFNAGMLKWSMIDRFDYIDLPEKLQEDDDDRCVPAHCATVIWLRDEHKAQNRAADDEEEEKEKDLRIDSNELETLEADFVIDADISSVFVYSLACIDKRDSDLAWDVITLHQFEDTAAVTIPKPALAHPSRN